MKSVISMMKLIKKKTALIFALFIFAFPVFSQGIPTMGILPFTAGTGATAADAEEVTRRVIAELSPVTTLSFLTGAQAENADYLIRGQIVRQNNQFIVTATTSETSTGRVLNNAREQAATVAAIPMFSFCAQATDNVGIPNYLLGRWRSTIDMIDGPVTCILEFRPNRVVYVQQYETWEHNGTDSLKYQAIGTGTYTFTAYHLRRTVTVGGRSIQTQAGLNIELTLEDALPRFESINVSGLRLVFDESRNSFELVNAGLPCGDNFSGPSVYPSATVYYTRFTKIQ